MLALIVLPIAASLLLAALARRVLRRAGMPSDWPAGLVAGGLLLCAFVVLVTEGLSLVTMLRPGPTIVAWLLLIASLAAVLWWTKGGRSNDAPATEPILPTSWREVRTPGFWLWIAVAGLLVFTLAVAICTPVNQHDALGYHLPRQIMWMDMGRVAHYATEDMREIQFPPLAEYAQMHTMLITGGDVWVQLTSWWVYALAALSAGLLCRAIGAPKVAPLAALIVACQPSMFMLSWTPKNDPMLTFSVLALAWLVFECVARRRCDILPACLIGLALGVGAMTKTSSALFMFPLCVVIAAGCLVQHRAHAFWRGGVMAAVALLMVAGHTWRNVDSFGSPLGPMSRADGGYGLSMERLDPPALASNVIRHASSHIPLPDRASAEAAEAVVRDLHARIGADPGDPKTSWLPAYTLSMNVGTLSTIPAPVHVVLVLAFPLIMGVRMALRIETPTNVAWLWLLWSCAFVAVVVFVGLVKWQIWLPRLHAPALALGAVPASIALWPPRRARSAWIATLACGGPTLAFLLWAGIPHSAWPHQGVWASLAHPRHPSLRWHPTEGGEVAERQLAVLEGLGVRRMAIVCWSMHYNVMRMARQIEPELRFTGLDNTLGRTDRVPPSDWQPPDVLVTERTPLAYTHAKGQLYRRVGPPGCLSVFVPSDRYPVRGTGEAMVGLRRYQAFEEFLPEHDLGHVRALYGFNAAVGDLLPPEGIDFQLPDDRVPRTLLLSLNPREWTSGEVSVLLDGEELARAELPYQRYTAIEVPIRPRLKGQTLAIRFPGAENRRFGAIVGWAQLPKSGYLTWYDRERSGQPAQSQESEPEARTP